MAEHRQPPLHAENGIISPGSSTIHAHTPPAPPPTSAAAQQAQGLPCYIQPLPASLSPADIEYLTKKGALTLPDNELQCELLRKYLQYIHPLMPVLDLAAFLSPIARCDGSSLVSLLIFQAAMFASVAFIDLEYLTARGYPNRRAARSIFFDRARLLYDLNCETNRVAILQALLLMTYWYEKPEDEKETWHWTGIALSQAQIQGIHRNPDGFNITPEMKSLRKRIWWSLFVRDRLLALGIRRPARVRSGDFDVPMLTLEDCEMAPFDDGLLGYLGPLPVATDPPNKRSIYLCFIELAKLCVHIGDILFTQYSILSNPSFGAEENVAMMVIPRKSAEQMQELAKSDLRLEDWLDNLDPACRYKVGESQAEGEQNGSYLVLRLHQAMLYMIYLTATAILHRPRALQSSPDPGDNGVHMRLSRKKVTQAAAGITEVVHDLYKENQLRFACTSTVPALISSTLIHLVDIRSSREEARYTSIGRFYQCWQALQYLRDMYASAEHATWFLEAVIQKANVNIPMLMLKPRTERFPAKLSTAPVDPQGLESRVSALAGANSLTGAFGGRYAPVAGANTDVVGQTVSSPAWASPVHFIPGAQDSFAQLQMEDVMPGDLPSASWGGFDTEDNILDALLRFNTDPSCVL